MCGIVGQVREDGARVERELLESMCAAVEHRGPDSRGIHLVDGVGLGAQRLRVIDLESGDQPIYNEDRAVAVVLNGEIYNFRELRERLVARGHRFATKGDTETIVHLYEEEGPECVRSLDGMFAFALWDSRRRQLVMARDRVGKKPLFYSNREGAGLSFASELRALMCDPEVPRDLDHQAIDCFLAYQYIPAPLSVFRHVRKLPPASVLVYRDGRVSIDRYWRLGYGRKRPVRDRDELREEIRDTVRRATRRRMVADVPLGAFLSGGIDSSTVVAAMAEQSSRPVRTFSIGFENDSLNELPYARRVADMFATEHHELVVKPDAAELIPRVVRQYGEPFADSSAIPSFHLAELAGRHVTVALNGDGGDEGFAGYTRYVGNPMARRLELRLDRLPLRLRRAIGAIGERVSPKGEMSSTRNRARRLARSLPLDPAARYARLMSYFDWVQRDRLYSPEFRELVGESLAPALIADAWHGASGDGGVDVMLEVDVETYLPGDLLVKMDIATMAHAVEARSPFLDPEVMELAASLPPELKAAGREQKIVLREALRGSIPDDILDRPKMGFVAPIADWFRHELRDWTRDILLDPVARQRGWFDHGYVATTLDRHARGVEDESPRIWALLVLELWLQDQAVPLASSTRLRSSSGLSATWSA
jgi:asparagine synthase (glutamine-hydrolysing)